MMLWAGGAAGAVAAGAFPAVAYSQSLKVSKSPKDGEAAILALAFTQPPVFPTWFNELLDHLGENTNAKVQRPHIFCPPVRGWQ